jgi:predicted Zn-dependent peptidase
VPANATLTLAGDLDRAAREAAGRQVVRHLPGYLQAIARQCRCLAIAGPQRRTVEDSLAKLRRIHYAWNTPALFAPGDAELDLLASALAQQGTGRLYKTLVLEKRWARNVAAFQESRQLSSIFHVFADLQDDAPLDEVEKVIDEEVERMDEDADGAGRAASRRRGFRIAVRVGTRVGAVARREPAELQPLHRRPRLHHRDLDRYRKATPASVQAVARSTCRRAGASRC